MGLGRSDRGMGDPMVGKVLGGCRIEERIGRGGMGTVYRALHESENRPVALKVLASFLASDPALVARFIREVRAASRIHHPNVVRMWTAAHEDGLYFTVMDYVHGENLADLLKREGRLPVGRAVAIAHEVSKALAALHAEGIIHRDIKPANILIGRNGEVKVTDFGIAWDASEIQRLTVTGDLLGTIGFAAPEQLDRSTVDVRADLYSLGATLHTMLTGVRPPIDPRLPVTPLGGDVPEAVRELLARMLARDPGGRPTDANSVASILATFAAAPAGPRRSIPRRIKRMVLAAGGGVLAFLAGASATVSHGPDFQAPPWTLVFPMKTALVPTLLIFGSATLLAFFSFIRGRERIHLGIRSVLGFTFLAASLVVAYLAGAAMGTLSLREAALSFVSAAPAALFADALTLAALGLFIGMKAPAVSARWAIGACLILGAVAAACTASSAGSVKQAIDDLMTALSQGAWAWLSFVLAGCGFLLASRHQGALWRLLLSPLAVFFALGMAYWSSQGEGSPSLRDAASGPEGAVALAVLLALGARVVLDLHPGSSPGALDVRAPADTTTAATPTP